MSRTREGRATDRIWALRALWLYTGLLVALGTVGMALRPPGIFSDSVSGFIVLQSMERGAPFNHTFVVDEADISKDSSEFTSWWTPGQYVVPMAFRALGFDLGKSMIATTIVVWILGLAGYFLLFRRLGISPLCSATSLAVLASQPHFLGWARFYHGGELLQWGYFPWCAWFALRLKDLRWYQAIALCLSLMLGIFFKSSFGILGAAIVAAILWMKLSGSKRLLSADSCYSLAKAVLIVIGALFALQLYVSAGRSPMGTGPPGMPHFRLHEILFSSAAPLSSLFDFWTLYLPRTESPKWIFGDINGSLALASLVTLALLFAIIKWVRVGRDYKIFLTVVYGAVVAAYSLAYALDLFISFHVRHLRLVGLLFLPGLISGLLQVRPRAVRWILCTVLAVASVAMVVPFVDPTSRDSQARPVGQAGFSHIYARQETLDALRELDEQLSEGNNLIGVPWPQMGLDMQKSRVFNMRTGLRSAGYFRDKRYFGHVDNLILVIPTQAFEDGTSQFVVNAFREHRGWRRIRPEVKEYLFMHSGTDTSLH